MDNNRSEELVRSDGSRITLDEIYARVTVVEPGIIRFQEVKHATPESLRLFGEQIRERGGPFGTFVLIVDLSESTRPDPDFREVMVDWMREQPAFHQCFVRPKNNLQRVALRFMLGRSGISVTVHDELEEAIDCAREVLMASTACAG